MTEQSLINNQTSMQANFDAKKYICGPWLKGARGGPWSLVFQPAFENALRAKTDQFSSLHDHIVTERGVGSAAMVLLTQEGRAWQWPLSPVLWHTECAMSKATV